MRSLTLSQLLAGTILAVSCLGLAGCATPKAAQSHDASDVAQTTSFCRPYLLYLLDSPHLRLYVEVDAVQGCGPKEAALNKLRDFLAAYCNKPAGIEIVRSDVIPVEAARGMPPRALAREYLNGPPDDPGASPPAFMYVLFYSGALSDEYAVAEAGRPSEKAAARPHERTVNPHAELLPYPSIFMNTGYGTAWGWDETLLHEAGHLLGLVHRPTYASGYHCLSPTCLMNKYTHLSRLLVGWQKRPCTRCVAELSADSKQPPPSNLRFVGPVLVRSEGGYHVLSLPNRLKVIMGDLAEQDCRDFAAAVRDETPTPGNDEWKGQGFIKDEVLAEPAKLHDIANRARNDPHDPVRAIASRIATELEPAATR